MAARKKKPKDMHKSRNMVRLDDLVHGEMKRLADENDRTISREVRRALVEYLKLHGRWPPPGETEDGP